MASLFPLRGFTCPPRLSTAEAGVVVMLNGQHARGSVSVMPGHGPSGIQPTLELNRDYLMGAGQNPNQAQAPGDGCSWLSESCSQQEAAK
jgi:hypothetical protein